MFDPTDAQRFDDLVIHHTDYLYTSEAGVSALRYVISVKDHPGHAPRTLYKVVRLLRITRVPVAPARRDTDSEYNKHRDVLAGSRAAGSHIVTILADTADAGLGVLHLMGVQGVGDSLEAATDLADHQFAALEGQLQGTYPQMQWRSMTQPEAAWLSSRQEAWADHVLAVRGIPMPRREAGSGQITIAGANAGTNDLEEGIEELVRGMLGSPGFILVLLASPLRTPEITSALRNAAQRLSRIASQVEGTNSVGIGVGLPIMLSGAMADTTGTAHTAGTSEGHSTSDSITQGTSATVSDSESTAVGQSRTVAAGTSISSTEGHAHSQGLSGGVTEGHGTAHARSLGTNTSIGEGHSTGQNQQTSHSESAQASTGHTDSASAGRSEGLNRSEGSNHTAGSQQARSSSLSESGSTSASAAHGTQSSASGGATTGQSSGHSEGTSNSIGVRVSGEPMGVGGSGDTSRTSSSSDSTATNSGTSTGWSAGTSDTISQGISHGYGATNSTSAGASVTDGTSSALGASVGTSSGVGAANSSSVGTGISDSVSRGSSDSSSVSRSAGVSDATSTGTNQSASLSKGYSEGVSAARSTSVGQSTTAADGVSTTHGRTHGVASGVSDSTGRSISDSVGRSDASTHSIGRASLMSGGMGLAPSLSISSTKRTLDAMAESLAKVLSAQRNRMELAQEEGGFAVQTIVLCPDKTTETRAASLLKSSFWGPGEKTPVPQPLHVITTLDAQQRRHLAAHARALSPCRHADIQPEAIEPHTYSTALLCSELAVLTAPIRSGAPGIAAAAVDLIPRMPLPVHRGGGRHLGRVVDTERAVVSNIEYALAPHEMLHPLVAGASDSGKTTTALRLATEHLLGTSTRTVIDPDTGQPREEATLNSLLALDIKSDWRRLKYALPSGSPRFRFYSLGRVQPDNYAPPPGKASPYFRYNLLRVPPGVSAQVYRDRVADTFAHVAHLGLRGRSIIAAGIDTLYRRRCSDPADNTEHSVYERPELSRFVDMAALAQWAEEQIKDMAHGSQKARVGSESKERMAIIAARLAPFREGTHGWQVYRGDPKTGQAQTLQITDLVGGGDVVVLEASHLDAAAGKLALALIFTAAFSFAQARKRLDSQTMVVLEEANAYLPAADAESVSGVSVSVFEEASAIGRALWMTMMVIVQSPDWLSNQMIANAGLVAAHRTETAEGKEIIMAKLGYEQRIDNRDIYKYLSRMGKGQCIIRPHMGGVEDSYLSSYPCLIQVTNVTYPVPTDAELGLPDP